LDFNYREVETLITKVNKINTHIFPLYHKSLPLYRRRPNKRKNILPGESGKISSKELDPETGFYYYGARYLDPRTSRWLSGDPAIGDYLPQAPVNDEAKKGNGNLPGQGGVFNLVNLHVYHYAGNNPVKYVDPDGETPVKPTGALGTFAHYAIFADLKPLLDSQGYKNVATNRRAGADENIPISRRRPDIAAIKNGRRSIWEIKPSGDTSGQKQLKDYKNIFDKGSKVPTDIGDKLFEGEKTIPFEIAGNENATLTYSFEGDGIIHYSIDDGEGIKQQSPNFNFAPTTESALQKNTKDAGRFAISGSIIMLMALTLLAF
jgi:RHS repeat-associated protein